MGQGQAELFPNVYVRSPVERLLRTPADRFRYVLNVLVRDLELPVERDDLLTPPDDNAALAQSVSLAGRKVTKDKFSRLFF